MAIFGCEIKKSLNGRSDKDYWKNSYFFTMNAPIDSPLVKEVVEHIADMEAFGHFDTVFFNDAYVFQVAENNFNKPAHNHVSIPLQGFGQRNTENLAVDDAKILPLEECLVVRRGTSRGRGGKLYYRGCLILANLIITENNSFAFQPNWLLQPNALGLGQMLVGLNAPLPNGAVMCLPDKVDTLFEQFAQQSRPVVNHTIGGIQHRARAVKRVPSATRVRQGVQVRITELGRALKEITAGGLVNSALSVAAIANIRAEVVELIEAVPASQYKNLRIPPNLKALPGI
jgi:hypothetical protein